MILISRNSIRSSPNDLTLCIWINFSLNTHKTFYFYLFFVCIYSDLIFNLCFEYFNHEYNES